MRFKRRDCLKVAALVICLAPVAGAFTPIPQLQSDSPPTEEKIVTTKHQITLGGRVLRYTARAGRLPILYNETGEARAGIFFTAYTLDPSLNQAPRPLTFLWNGGPGSSSSLVHLLGFGPRRLRPDGAAVDNQGTWLDHADLVFVDPVGTGYSRPARAEYGPEFYQTRGDAESVAEFIRVYRNRFEVWRWLSAAD
jgi:carboxypeptidase C (cathepsin A)